MKEGIMTDKISLPGETKVGVVALTVPDLTRALSFYEGVLGMQPRQEDGSLHLSAKEGTEIVWLYEDPASPAPTARATGLYHFAIRVPTRADLGRVIQGFARQGYPLQGAADHLVSEALYLADPFGNGIEIYRDRPRAEWPYQNGSVQMASDPLDVEGILQAAEVEAASWEGLPSGTDLGHVHLKVSDLAAAEAFYTGVLGFDLVTHYGRSASFVSAGGYHHHVGMNTWNSAGGSPPPAGAQGLRFFSVSLPRQADLDAAAERLRAAGYPVEQEEMGWLAHDPAGNGVLLTLS